MAYDQKLTVKHNGDKAKVTLLELNYICDHDYQKSGQSGIYRYYTCTKCGDELEKDVS